MPPFDGSFINPVALAELMDISVPELERRMASGEIKAYQTPDGEWAVPRSVAYEMLGILVKPQPLSIEVDGQLFEVTLQAPGQ